jgi:hypothetical protein
MSLRLPSYEKIIIHEEMITVEQLLQRWTGIRSYELTRIIQPPEHQTDPTGSFVERHPLVFHGDKDDERDHAFKKLNIKIYVIDKVLEDGSGKQIYHCRKGGIATLQSRLVGRDFGYDVGFILSEIRIYEENNPYVLYKIIDLKETQKKMQLSEAQQRIASLEEENVSLKAQLAESKQEYEALRQSVSTKNEEVLTPQRKASAARQEKALNAWKPAICAMIKVAVRCGEEGRRLRQQPDFNMMFNELDAEPSDSQKAFFRACLPDEHIDRTGGARSKD